MINLNIEDQSFEEIKDILGTMFLKHGLSNEVVRSSQWVDHIVVTTQKERQSVYSSVKETN